MKRALASVVVLLSLAGVATASGEYEDGPDGVDGVGVRMVEVRAATMDVAVTQGDAAEVVSGTEEDSGWGDVMPGTLRRERDGDRLFAWVETDGPFSAPVHGSVRVKVPRGASVVIRTTSGDVTITGVEARRLDVRTASGTVTLAGVRGRVLVESVSGPVTIDSVDGPVDARTVSGSIFGRNLLLSDYSELATVSGDIALAVASGLESMGFDLRSVSGSLRVGSIRTERGLRMGFGRTLVKVRSISGSVSIQ